jgi:RHS repeat-associated protein
VFATCPLYDGANAWADLDNTSNITKPGRMGCAHQIVEQSSSRVVWAYWDRVVPSAHHLEGLDNVVPSHNSFDCTNAWIDFYNTRNITKRYLATRVIDELLAQISSAGVLNWYLGDLLGSTRDIVNSDGTAVLDHIKYDSYGNILSETSPASGDRFKYTGREWDATTGQYFYRARYYTASAGRFTSQDPIKFSAGDSNTFRYVDNRANIAVDPSGLAERVPLTYPRLIQLARDEGLLTGKEDQNTINRIIGDAMESVVQRTKPLLEKNSTSFNSPLLTNEQGKKRGVRPDFIAPTLIAAGAWPLMPAPIPVGKVPCTCFVEVKSGLQTVRLDSNDGQVKGLIDVLKNNIAPFKKIGLRGTLVFVTTAETKIHPDIYDWGRIRNVNIIHKRIFLLTENDGAVKLEHEGVAVPLK